MHGAELVLPHPVGDFVNTGGALVRVYGGEFDDRATRKLEGMIALGDERTFDQDPAFAIRMMVDIANRALSPAVNDPTTAVQVLDHLGEVLGVIGSTDLEKRTKPASVDTPAAVVMVTRRWEDFVTLGLTEIREYGATSVQVMRRLRALLEELLETVRPEHRAALEEELRRLDATVADVWRDSVDHDRATRADGQGIGDPRVARRAAPRQCRPRDAIARAARRYSGRSSSTGLSRCRRALTRARTPPVSAFCSRYFSATEVSSATSTPKPVRM